MPQGKILAKCYNVDREIITTRMEKNKRKILSLEKVKTFQSSRFSLDPSGKTTSLLKRILLNKNKECSCQL